MHGVWLGGALGVLLCAWTGTVEAESLGGLSAVGDCPGEGRLQAALERRQLPPVAAAHQLSVVPSSGGAELSLLDGTGQRVLARRLESEDCDALADTVALIIEAYFVELASRRADAPATTATATPAAPAAPAPSPEPLPPNAAPTPAPNATARANKPVFPQSPVTTSAPSAPPDGPANSANQGRYGAVLSLGAGADWLPESQRFSLVGGGGIGLSTPIDALELELHAVTGTSVTLGEAPNRVRRRETRLAGRAALGFGTKPVVAPWLGVGVGRATLEGVDLAISPEREQLSLLLEAGVRLSEPVSARWSLREELGCRLLTTREEYRVAPDGVIGVGPRFACSLLAGFTWSSEQIHGD